MGYVEPRTLFGAAAAAAFFTTNIARKLALALLGSGSAALAFLVALPLPFFLIAVAPGLRPAPGRHPPLAPFLPGIIYMSREEIGTQCVMMARIPKKVNPQVT